MDEVAVIESNAFSIVLINTTSFISAESEEKKREKVEGGGRKSDRFGEGKREKRWREKTQLRNAVSRFVLSAGSRRQAGRYTGREKTKYNITIMTWSVAGDLLFKRQPRNNECN